MFVAFRLFFPHMITFHFWKDVARFGLRTYLAQVRSYCRDCMKKIYVLKTCFAVLAGVVLLVGGITHSAAQGPPPLPETGWLRSSFRFDTTNWLTMQGFGPRSW